MFPSKHRAFVHIRHLKTSYIIENKGGGRFSKKKFKKICFNIFSPINYQKYFGRKGRTRGKKGGRQRGEKYEKYEKLLKPFLHSIA